MKITLIASAIALLSILLGVSPDANADPALCGGLLPGHAHGYTTACATGHGGTSSTIIFPHHRGHGHHHHH